MRGYIIAQPIEHTHTGKGNPGAITHFDSGLSRRQQRLLDSLPEYGSRVTVTKNSVSMKDLAALTAKAGVEFALFTRGSRRLIVRGDAYSVNINDADAKELAEQGYRWSGHTHPGYNRFILRGSEGDRNILSAFSQERSAVYNSLGQFRDFRKE
ncbi:MAG: hypothetical protein LBM98_08190 [Oscillospiraceae bacterium]|nr:hypothetical protein [Oscillospiraceae bacterium]